MNRNEKYVCSWKCVVCVNILLCRYITRCIMHVYNIYIAGIICPIYKIRRKYFHTVSELRCIIFPKKKKLCMFIHHLLTNSCANNIFNNFCTARVISDDSRFPRNVFLKAKKTYRIIKWLLIKNFFSMDVGERENI